MKVLVYGGTGSQARPTVHHLLEQKHTPYVVTRNPGKATDLKDAGACLVKGDLGDLDRLVAVSEGVDAVAFLLPAFLDNPDDGIRFGCNAIDAARQANVNMFVWNASGEIANDTPNTKRSVLRHLQATQLPYVVLEPTTYMENWLGVWTAPSVRENNELSYPVLADRQMGWIASNDVGALVVAALERPALAGNRFRISGIERPTGPELARLFTEACGRDIRYRAMTPEEMGAVLDREFGRGAGDAVAEMYRQEQEDPDPPAKYHDMTSVLEALPVRMSTIFDWITAHKDAFVP